MGPGRNAYREARGGEARGEGEGLGDGDGVERGARASGQEEAECGV